MAVPPVDGGVVHLNFNDSPAADQYPTTAFGADWGFDLDQRSGPPLSIARLVFRRIRKRALDHVADRLPGAPIEPNQPHLLDRLEILRIGVDLDPGQQNRGLVIPELPLTNKSRGIRGAAWRNRAVRWSSAFRMGQAAWHHAQDQTSRHRSRRHRLLLNLIAYHLIRILAAAVRQGAPTPG
ncbi:hypothetical protein GWE18_21870 [Bradyrhizobium sp. CSA112]|uniref:hypothetical protein n=1 Tax=Bradyrhizobium sp. CSA112 TaxID=2699170 RepID=UPI0023B10E1F|nr:hypothetical protein [Bradyrhizobium sp. CSA112]MDE5455436.1 hypothetical protein [Bradyrhizobium sp. CSA112]